MFIVLGILIGLTISLVMTWHEAKEYPTANPQWEFIFFEALVFGTVGGTLGYIIEIIRYFST